MTLRLGLASASPRRLSLLAQIGLTPSMVVAADLDESILAGELPAAYVTRLAEAKARAVAAQHVDALVNRALPSRCTWLKKRSSRVISFPT